MAELSRVLPFIGPTITVLSLVGGGAVAYQQIGNNSDAIKDLEESKVEVEAFTSHSSTSREARTRAFTRIAENKAAIEENEEDIDVLERGDIQAAGEIQLQLERLSRQQQTDKEALERQLELILQLLRQQQN